jgi:hypothetical protein
MQRCCEGKYQWCHLHLLDPQGASRRCHVWHPTSESWHSTTLKGPPAWTSLVNRSFSNPGIDASPRSKLIAAYREVKAICSFNETGPIRKQKSVQENFAPRQVQPRSASCRGNAVLCSLWAQRTERTHYSFMEKCDRSLCAATPPVN